MATVTFLGTGFSLPTALRHAISIHVQGAASILVDAGGDPSKGLARRDLLGGLDAVVITHRHTDHTGGLPGLVHASRFVNRDRPLIIAAMPEVVRSLQAACAGLDAQAPYGLEWIELDPEGEGFEIAGSDVRTAPADHTVPALAVRVNDVTYSSDTRPSQPVIDLAHQSALLVHEATHGDAEFMAKAKHSTPGEAGRVARAADVDALALVHMHPSLDPEDALAACGFSPAWAPVDGDQLVRDGAKWRLMSESMGHP